MNKVDLLQEVANDNVRWRDRGRAGRSYRLYSSEYDYTTVTPTMKDLIADGLVEEFRGWTPHKGGVSLTLAGRKMLANRLVQHKSTDTT